MKTQLLCFMAILLLLGGSFTSCESDSTLSFTEYSLNKAQYWDINYENNENIILINNDEDMKKHFLGTEYPPIDFSKQSLLLISGTTNKGIANQTINSIEALSNNKFKIDIELSLTLADVMQPWVITALVSKIGDNSKIEVNVKINN